MPDHTMPIVRVFIASPGDVAHLRPEAEAIINSVARRASFHEWFHVEIVRWDDPIAPVRMNASQYPQEAIDEALPRPSECELTIAILWSRLGTPVRRASAGEAIDESGTEWEINDALVANRTVLIYRCTEGPTADLEAGEDTVVESVRQYGLVKAFFDKIDSGNAGPVRSYATFRTAAEFRRRLESDIHTELHQILRRRYPTTVAQVTPPSREEMRTYLEWLGERLKGVELLGMRLQHAQNVVLRNVYVPLTCGNGSSSKESPESRRGVRVPDEFSEKIAPVTGRPARPPALIMDRLGGTSLCLVGAAGSGKSTFCRWVAWLCATGESPRLDIDLSGSYNERLPISLTNRVPILVPLRELKGALLQPIRDSQTCTALETVLLNWAEERQLPDLTRDVLRTHLARGVLLIVLDGADEISLSDRNQFLSALAAAMPLWQARQHRVLLTTRPHSLDDTEIAQLGLATVAIAALPTELQTVLVRRWFQILAGNGGDSIAAEMLRQARGQAWVAPLMSSPLLLTGICIVFSEGKAFPQDKHDLFDRIVDCVLFSRVKDKARLQLIRSRLCVVAHGMHTGALLNETHGTPHAEVTKDEIDRMLRAFQDRAEWTEQHARDIHHDREELIGHTGLLLPHSLTRAGFVHSAFQDFLTAQRIADGDPAELPKLFSRYSAFPEWRNTLSFVFANLLSTSVSPDRAAGLFATLVESIDAEQLGLALVCADCFDILAGKGLTTLARVRTRFGGECLRILRSDAPAVDRCRMGRTLGLVGDVRFAKELWWLPSDGTLGFVEVPGGRFKREVNWDVRRDGLYEDRTDTEADYHEISRFYIAKWPITVAQFGVFVEAGFTPADRGWDTGGCNEPVVFVSWYEARAYCEWLDRMLLQSGRIHKIGRFSDSFYCVDLPTAGEWGLAAKGFDERVFPWGNSFDASKGNFSSTGWGRPNAVGCFGSGASPHLVEELAGNVFEWTRSSWGKFPYNVDCTDEVGARDDVTRVVRGGAFDQLVTMFPLASRQYPPGYRAANVGFRVVLRIGSANGVAVREPMS